MFDDLRRYRAAKRVRPGDGRPLERFRWWQLFTGRKLFSLGVGGTVYAVDVRASGKQTSDDRVVHLYVDGRHHARSRMPAVIPVDGGTIQVAMSAVGLKRAHYVTDAGAEHLLTPDPRSAIGRRLRLDREHRTLSRWIAAFSVLALVVGAGINLVQLLEPILGVPPIVERFGRFESPIELPVAANVALGLPPHWVPSSAAYGCATTGCWTAWGPDHGGIGVPGPEGTVVTWREAVAPGLPPGGTDRATA